MDKIRYDLIDCYTMKCRLYVNETQKATISNILEGIRVFYNCTLWEMFNNFECTTEKKKKTKSEEESDGLVHFPNLRTAQTAEWKNRLAKEHPIIDCVPSGAILGNNGCVHADMAKSLGKMPVEFQKPLFYSKRHPRTSYTYQETCGKVEESENKNVLYITLNKLGRCKIRGWNQKIRFDENGSVNFVDYCKAEKKKQITVTISVDTCGDYWICFKLLNVYKPIKDFHGEAVGIDVGIKDIAILSDETKFENKKFKKVEKRNLKLLNRQMSRRHGWANEQFRAAYKKNPEVSVSNGYEKSKLAKAKLERRIARRRNNWNNIITYQIISEHDAIAVESLNVRGMFRNKHLAYALSDAAMGDILAKLSYKSNWHHKELRQIGRWTPSSKRCSNCGTIKNDLKLSDREWTCRSCKKHHDRDVNAAINILYYAYELDVPAVA